ncbi:MAG: hypothetical protein Kow0031_31830 [Anaerolineae bacterium]
MRSILGGFFIVLLVVANVVTAVVLWSMVSDVQQVSAALQQEPTPDSFLLPEPTVAGQPTPLPTPVTVIEPTATLPPTATPAPVPPPTETPAPLPTATPPPPAAEVAAANLPPPTASARPNTEYVVIISIDGLRPDALFLAHTPTLDSLIERGAYSPNAQTLPLSVTLPSHASMLSGMTPAKHGIEWGLPYIGWPGMNGPTVFSVAHNAGLKTAMVFGKEKLSYIALPGSVDFLFGQDVHDPEVKDRAIEAIVTDMPHLLFVHFPDTDRVGHTYGWMSENQLQSIAYADGLIGEIVAALEQQGYLERALIIVTADHGGHGMGHGDDSPEDRTIPWLAAGPQVRPGVSLTGAINTYDTAATALYALNLPVPEVWDGRPVREAFLPAP